MDRVEMLDQAAYHIKNMGDIRATYGSQPLSRNYMLTYEFPAAYRPEEASFGIEKKQMRADEAREKFGFHTAGFDTALVVLRYLQHFIVSDYHEYPHEQGPGPAIDPEQAEAEEAHPILRMIWADSDHQGDKGVETYKSIEVSQMATRYLIFKLMQEQHGKDEFSFLEIMENEEMHSHFWSKTPYLLFNPEVPYRVGPNGKWTVIKVDPAQLAAQSKLEWDCNGSLGDLVTSLFGFKDYSEGPSDFRCVKRTGDAAILRVHMKPSDGRRARWETVREFSFQQFSHRNVVEVNETFMEGVTSKVTVTLVAAVHMPQEGVERVRLYGVDGTQMHMTEGMVRYAIEDGQEDVIRMGDPNEGQWMLYYIKAPDFRFKRDWPETARRLKPILDDENYIRKGDGQLGTLDDEIVRYAAEHDEASECPWERQRDRAGPPLNAPTGPRSMVIGAPPMLGRGRGGRFGGPSSLSLQPRRPQFDKADQAARGQPSVLQGVVAARSTQRSRDHPRWTNETVMTTQNSTVRIDGE